MGEWSFLSSLLDEVQEHSPMVGRFWLVVMLIFRILILATVGSDMFEDEQEEFACNTLQPGCKQVCYDKAFPLSHYRFWVFHIVVLSAPAVLFVIYSMHQRAKTGPGGQDGHPRVPPGPRSRHVRAFYLLNVAGRILAETGFLVGQWLLYGFRVEPHFTCVRPPLPPQGGLLRVPPHRENHLHPLLLRGGGCLHPPQPAGAGAPAGEGQVPWAGGCQTPPHPWWGLL
uniref:Gap junction protein delta 3 n=1 Tax=Pelusios castaneus TaxID=367368 RepID=A0A8C8SB39_9SAUR